MKRKTALPFLLIAASLFTIGTVLLFYQLYVVEYVYAIPASAIAIEGNIAGFNVDLNVLNFGKITRDSKSYRYFYVNNTANYPLELTLSSRGNLSRYLHLSPSEGIIEPNSAKRIEATVQFLSTSELGNYSGVVIVKLTKKII